MSQSNKSTHKNVYCFLRDERSKARKQWYKFFGNEGRRKNGSSRNKIPELTEVEDNFLAEVFQFLVPATKQTTDTSSTVKIGISKPVATMSDVASLQQEEKANEMKGLVDCVVGLDARGFLFGPIMAAEIGVAFVPVSNVIKW